MSEMEDETIAIRPAAGIPTLPRAARPPDPHGCLRPRMNERLNSRLTQVLPSGKWQLRWQTPLDSQVPPPYLIQVANRVIVPLGTACDLFDRDGKRIASESLGEGEVVADPVNSLFYMPTPTGHIAARKLSDGRQVFATGGFGGRAYRRQFIARRDNSLITLSVEFLGHAHGLEIPSHSGIEVQDLGAPLKVTDSGLLVSASIKAEQELDRLHVPLALNDNVLVVAAPNRIELLDLNLRKCRELTGSFTPQTLSLDELGNIYLLARTEKGSELWVLTPQGDRTQAVDLPSDVSAASAPPIIGYDHSVYIVSGPDVTAIRPNGEIAWSRKAEARVAAGVTAFDQLLVVAGRELFVFDREGERRLLYRWSDENFDTPPVITADGEILVASQRHLYCLVAELEQEKTSKIQQGPRHR